MVLVEGKENTAFLFFFFFKFRKIKIDSVKF